MGKVLFFNVPAHGHTNPTLPVVRELTARGEKVIYCSFPEFRDKIEAAGAEFRTCDNFPPIHSHTKLVSRMSTLYQSILYATSVILDEMIALVEKEKPDYIIHDSLCVWGKYAAEIAGIPAIASSSTFVFNSGSINLKMILTELLRFNAFLDLKPLLAGGRYHRHFYRKYGIPKGNFVSTLSGTGKFNLVYTSRELQPGGARLESDRFLFVGPSVSERKDDPDTTDYAALPKPLVYISLGTILNDNRKFYGNCFKAFSGFPGSVVISAGKAGSERDYGVLPSCFSVKSHVNQLEILKHADAFISHGGMNSVHEALFHGVPLCVYPFHVEQESVADRVVETGCGLILKSIRPGVIRRSVDTLLGNPRFRECCLAMSRSIREAGGYRRAVDGIFEFRKRNGIG